MEDTELKVLEPKAGGRTRHTYRKQRHGRIWRSDREGGGSDYQGVDK